MYQMWQKCWRATDQILWCCSYQSSVISGGLDLVWSNLQNGQCSKVGQTLNFLPKYFGSDQYFWKINYPHHRDILHTMAPKQTCSLHVKQKQEPLLLWPQSSRHHSCNWRLIFQTYISLKYSKQLNCVFTDEIFHSRLSTQGAALTSAHGSLPLSSFHNAPAAGFIWCSKVIQGWTRCQENVMWLGFDTFLPMQKKSLLCKNHIWQSNALYN